MQARRGPAHTGSAHLAAGAASPSRFGPSPRPQGPSCRQSSCHLRACKRLQQTWGGGRGKESPEGPLVRRGPGSVASPPPCPHQGTLCAGAHTRTRAHTHASTRPPDSQATDSQTDPLPNQEGPAPSWNLFITPQLLLGGAGPPQPPPTHQGCQALPTPTRQSSPLLSRRPKSLQRN